MSARRSSGLIEKIQEERNRKHRALDGSDNDSAFAALSKENAVASSSSEVSVIQMENLNPPKPKPRISLQKEKGKVIIGEGNTKLLSIMLLFN